MVRIKSIEEIQNFTCFIRSLRKGLITNFYLNVEKHSIWIEAGEFFVHETPECIFFLHENGNFYHLFFTATSTESLCAALQKASFCNELLSIDILGAKENVVKDALVNIGFYEYKSLYRMYHIGYPLQYEMEKIADMATIKDIDEIYHILNQDFDPLSEQIPTKGELALAISKKEILIFRAESKIKGLILFELSKLNMYLRFWWVDKIYRNQHIGAFLYHSLMNLAKGTKRQMHWVISTNDNAIKRYKHYGYIAESLYDYVLLNKKSLTDKNEIMKEQIIEILTNLRPEFDFTEDVDFIEEGMIDSLDVVNLVAELELTYNINIDGLDVVPENFSTIDNIMKLLSKNGVK